MSKDSDSARDADPIVVDYLRKRAEAHADILDGRLPTIAELFAGAPFFSGDMQKDIKVWASSYLENPDRCLSLGDHAGLMEVVRDTVEIEAVEALDHEFAREQLEDSWRTSLYLVCSRRDTAKRATIAQRIMSRLHFGPTETHLHELAVAHALMIHNFHSMVRYCEWGLRHLDDVADDLRALELAKKEFESAPDPQPDAKMTAVAEDRAEIVRGLQPAAPAGLVVVPKLDEKGAGSARKDFYKSWNGKNGVPLPLIGRGDVGAHAGALMARWPHAVDVVEAILADLSAREPVRIRPTLLLGPPGSGKSTLARAIAEQIGLPVELVSLAGLADSSIMGTSAQWTNARESVPLQLIRKSGTANPAVIWDEIDKMDTGRNNGSAADALLAMFEPGQARAYRDLALEVEVDLSMVSHIATANDLNDVPMPLRNRMRILRMPTPGWQHIGPLVRGIVDDIAKDRGIDPGWIEPLAQDEIEIVKKAWPGGSLRQLQRIVAVIVDGRETIMGRC